MESAYLISLLHFEFYTLYCSPGRADSLPDRELTGLREAEAKLSGRAAQYKSVSGLFYGHFLFPGDD